MGRGPEETRCFILDDSASRGCGGAPQSVVDSGAKASFGKRFGQDGVKVHGIEPMQSGEYIRGGFSKIGLLRQVCDFCERIGVFWRAEGEQAETSVRGRFGIGRQEKWRPRGIVGRELSGRGGFLRMVIGPFQAPHNTDYVFHWYASRSQQNRSVAGN